MPTTSEAAATEPAAGSNLPADSLALGVSFMMAITVLQRVVGFGRGVLFCRLLTDDELGQWSLAFSFLLLAAPLAVLGLPGSFGRYAEHYSRRKQLRVFLRRTTMVSAVLAAIGVGVVFFASESIAWLVFKDRAQSNLVKLLAAALATAATFNFVNELLVSLRQVRTSACMQFVHSLVFSICGVGLVACIGFGVWSLVIAYIAAGIAGLALAGLLTRRHRLNPTDASDDSPLPHLELWRKLLPFAAWVWVINILTNLFDAADRYMILHLAPLEAHAAQGVVGQYHSSRILPLLLLSVTSMFGAILLPYLSHDWEAGRKALVGKRLTLMFKLVAVGLTMAGVGLLLTAPWLFRYALAGRYADGLAVLPGATIYCVWFSLIMIAQNYLWCAEKARLVSGGMFVGLLLNLLLNWMLVPHWGLSGAVVATGAANGLALVLVLYFSRRQGMPVDAGCWFVVALPILLMLGALGASVGLLVVVIAGMFGDWLLSAEDRIELDTFWRAAYEKLTERLTGQPCSNNAI